MSRKIHRLSARSVKTITIPGLYPDGNGLYLRVGAGAARSWVYIYKREQKRSELGLGSVRDVSLAEARERAVECRKKVLAGEDPRQRGEATVPTFAAMAEEVMAGLATGFRNDKHKAQWRSTLATVERSEAHASELPSDRTGTSASSNGRARRPSARKSLKNKTSVRSDGRDAKIPPSSPDESDEVPM
jgi:hypothetical protein